MLLKISCIFIFRQILEAEQNKGKWTATLFLYFWNSQNVLKNTLSCILPDRYYGFKDVVMRGSV